MPSFHLKDIDNLYIDCNGLVPALLNKNLPVKRKRFVIQRCCYNMSSLLSFAIRGQVNLPYGVKKELQRNVSSYLSALNYALAETNTDDFKITGEGEDSKLDEAVEAARSGLESFHQFLTTNAKALEFLPENETEAFIKNLQRLSLKADNPEVSKDATQPPRRGGVRKKPIGELLHDICTQKKDYKYSVSNGWQLQHQKLFSGRSYSGYATGMLYNFAALQYIKDNIDGQFDEYALDQLLDAQYCFFGDYNRNSSLSTPSWHCQRETIAIDASALAAYLRFILFDCLDDHNQLLLQDGVTAGSGMPITVAESPSQMPTDTSKRQRMLQRLLGVGRTESIHPDMLAKVILP